MLKIDKHHGDYRSLAFFYTMGTFGLTPLNNFSSSADSYSTGCPC